MPRHTFCSKQSEGREGACLPLLPSRARPWPVAEVLAVLPLQLPGPLAGGGSSKPSTVRPPT